MILVTWQPAANAVKYEVSATPSNGGNMKVVVEGTSANLNLSATISHSITVTGINAAGAKGVPSDPITYTPPPLPEKVEGVEAVAAE